jgi:hypothetical protein
MRRATIVAPTIRTDDAMTSGRLRMLLAITSGSLGVG